MMTGTGDSKTATDAERDNALEFKPIEKSTIPGEIIDQIFSMLITGKLKAGDRLPPERQLCESLNVGRSSVREALKALETVGIVRRDIRGTTICMPEENPYPGLPLAASSASPEQIFESARIVGIEAVGLAAKRARQEDIEKILNSMQESEDTEKAATIHLSFLRALVDAAHNPILSQMHNMITALAAQSRQLSSVVQNVEEQELRAFMGEIFDGRRRILEAIESRDPAAAKRSMKELLECMETMALRGEQSAKTGQR